MEDRFGVAVQSDLVSFQRQCRQRNFSNMLLILDITFFALVKKKKSLNSENYGFHRRTNAAKTATIYFTRSPGASTTDN